MAIRIEKDTFGPIEVPEDRLWGAQTQRSLTNFKISTEKMPAALIKALAQVKRAAAKVNMDLAVLDAKKGKAIVQAADEVIAGKHDGEFPLAVWQTGSGTQTNMNMNEVLANRASEILGGRRGEERLVHPNDDVNKGQSSNDVFPTAMHVAAVPAIVDQLIPAVRQLRDTLAHKSEEFRDIVKIGRTHLQDAVPLTLGQEFSGYAAQLELGIGRIRQASTHLLAIAQGGTGLAPALMHRRILRSFSRRDLLLSRGSRSSAQPINLKPSLPMMPKFSHTAPFQRWLPGFSRSPMICACSVPARVADSRNSFCRRMSRVPRSCLAKSIRPRPKP